jgi:hypothetical protein
MPCAKLALRSAGFRTLAFDLYAFDPFAAPQDRHDFLDWISRAFRSVDSPLSDASITSPALRAWHEEMRRSIPGATFRFTQQAVMGSFDWEQSGAASFRARRSAQARGVGLFEASGHDGAVFAISKRNRWELIHRADDAGRDFG